MGVVAGSFTTHLDAARTLLDVSPIDPALTKAAMLNLIGAYCQAHYRMPSTRAVADVWRMLPAAPRAEVPANVLRARGLADDRERPFDQ